jgi:hypothetical protein
LNVGEETLQKLYRHLFSVSTPVNIAYLIRLLPENASEMPTTDSDDELLRVIMQEPLKYSHTFMLRVCKSTTESTAAIIQAFFGYYNVETWSNYDAPLKLCVPLDRWHRELNPHPKFRKFLKDGEILDLVTRWILLWPVAIVKLTATSRVSNLQSFLK